VVGWGGGVKKCFQSLWLTALLSAEDKKNELEFEFENEIPEMLQAIALYSVITDCAVAKLNVFTLL
jgi:hypothetical protein